MYDKLREIRNKKGISGMEMAKLLGLKTKAAYYKKEQGAIKFTLEEARIISKKLNMPIESIFCTDEVSAMETKTGA